MHGRKDDLINRGGENIAGRGGRRAARHPAVAEAAAFAVPHPRLGQDFAAAVVLRPGMEVRAGELRRYLLERVAPFKVPRRILIRNQLPRGVTGKVLRRLLSDFPNDGPVEAREFTAPENADGSR